MLPCEQQCNLMSEVVHTFKLKNDPDLLCTFFDTEQPFAELAEDATSDIEDSIHPGQIRTSFQQIDT